MVIRVGQWNWGGFVGKRVEEMKVKKEFEGSRVSVPNRIETECLGMLVKFDSVR